MWSCVKHLVNSLRDCCHVSSANMLDDQRKIGITLVALGCLFLGLGVLLFFDRPLLAIGNLLFLCGFPFLIGFERSVRFFNPLQRTDRWRGIVCFIGGVVLVLIGWPLVGIVVEAIGFMELFGPFLPMVVTFLRTLPGVGHFLALPLVAPIIDRLTGKRLPV